MNTYTIYNTRHFLDKSLHKSHPQIFNRSVTLPTTNTTIIYTTLLKFLLQRISLLKCLPIINIIFTILTKLKITFTILLNFLYSCYDDDGYHRGVFVSFCCDFVLCALITTELRFSQKLG